MKKIILDNTEPEFNADSSGLAKVITSRLGLLPRKKGSNDGMHNILLQLYERSKESTKEKDPEKAVMTVEDMAAFAGITKQTMYDYLERWLDIELISKVSFVGKDRKTIIGYKLNGSNLEESFNKTKNIVLNNLNITEKYIQDLQKIIKNEKIKAKMKKE
ncbi:MAG: hypothetical protein ACQER9_02550 [Nanobdellota archaeon]